MSVVTRELWKLVRQLEEQSEKEKQDYATCKATMLVNYGESGRTRSGWIKDSNMSLLQMIMTVCSSYEMEIQKKLSFKGDKNE